MLKRLQWNSDIWSRHQCSWRIVLWIVYWISKWSLKRLIIQSGFFEAVFWALREKTDMTDDQFMKYLEVLSDKDHEKVLESIAKVDKPMWISSPPACRRFSYHRGAGCVNRSSVQCYYCYQFGHYQNSCPLHLLRRAGSSSNLKSSVPCLSLFNNSERVAINNNSLLYFGCCVYLCGFPCCPGGGGEGG